MWTKIGSLTEVLLFSQIVLKNGQKPQEQVEAKDAGREEEEERSQGAGPTETSSEPG